MKVKVRLYALAKERAGCSEIELELPDGATVADLKRAITVNFDALGPMVPSMMIALNAEYANDTDRIPLNAEIAAIPPVSGGACEGSRCDD